MTAAEALAAAWPRSDALFALLADGALLERPIPLRQPFLFYLGHLPAFAWNQLGRRAAGLPSLDAGFESLFERGIDPVGVDEYRPDSPEAWPPAEAVVGYRDRVRSALQEVLAGDAGRLAETAELVLEHELMHQETLLYMVQQLSAEAKKRPADAPEPVFEGAAPRAVADVPAGRAALGAPRDSQGFGWDNEFPEHALDVAAFRIDTTPVRNSEFLAFVESGGYAARELWSADDWAWRERRRIRHPHGWRRQADAWLCRGLFEELELPRVADWPVAVSHAEAAAYARWRGARLPSEAEFHRAAYSAPAGPPRRFPWGETPPEPARANLGISRWSPTPVGLLGEGASAWGVLDLLGNGWEWTSSPFAGFPGFAPMAAYPGYSADFFDGRHFVMLGGSWATDARLARRSFRNWFQPHYPYVFSQFRLVR